jgi:hypothetical protein
MSAKDNASIFAHANVPVVSPPGNQTAALGRVLKAVHV